MAVLILDTSDNGTTVIAACLVFVAYFLHPAVDAAFRKVRAYFAWRAIESHKTVEITIHPLPAGILRGRVGGWDSARALAVLFICFVVASWGFALSLDLADVSQGPVDLMNRPPPVFVRSSGNSTRDGSSGPAVDWDVLDSFNVDGVPDGGTLGNFEGSLEAGNATSRSSASQSGRGGRGGVLRYMCSSHYMYTLHPSMCLKSDSTT